jgi:MFS transporter, ACS family, tartrate transporter
VMIKVAWHIVPFLMLLYFVAFVDRVNIAFASLQINADIGRSSDFPASIFYGHR